MLREMGLAPQWHLRREAGVADRVESAPAAVAQTKPAADTPAGTDDRHSNIMRMDWTQIKAAVAACTACALHVKRHKTVFGVGDENADWLFVGEGPGADEDAQGEPFVGQAGKLLDSMLAAIQL